MKSSDSIQVHGSIRINNGSKINHFFISSNHDFFKAEYVIVKVEYERLIFTIPTIDYNGKMLKSNIHFNDDRWRHFTVVSELLITGKFYIDEEESDEDKLVVYYR